MIKITVALLMLTMSLFSHAITKAELLTQVNGMTNDQIWTTITTPVNGWTGFGKCRMQIANPGCPSCACDYYFKSAISGSLGLKGWPKNPASGDSTGCMQWSGEPTCWGGYTPAMCTGDVKQNARAMLVNALQSALDVCDLVGYTASAGPATPATSSIAITDSSKFIFVTPGESCTAGKVLCGTTEIAPPVNGMKVFTKLSPVFCNAALGVIEKKTSTLRTRGVGTTGAGAKLISCAKYNSLLLSASDLVNARNMEGQLTYQWYGPNMAEVIPYLDYSVNQLNDMNPSQISLFRAAVGHDRLPAIVKAKVAAISTATPDIISRGPAAIEKLRQPPVNGGNTDPAGGGQPSCTLENVISYISTGTWPSHCQ